MVEEVRVSGSQDDRGGQVCQGSGDGQGGQGCKGVLGCQSGQGGQAVRGRSRWSRWSGR